MWIQAIGIVVATFAVAGCSGKGWEDPNEVYGRIVEAVKGRDGGVIYDLLDSARKAQVDTFIGAQLANLDKLPAEERPMWEALKGEPKRSIYAKVMASDPTVGEIFGGGATVMRIDTMIYLTVDHGSRRDLLYLRPVDGRLRITNSPDVVVYGPRQVPKPNPPRAPDDSGSVSERSRRGVRP